MADISKVKMPNNSTTYDIISKTGRGIVRCETDSSSTSTAFVVTVSGITSLYDGIILCIKNTKVKSAKNCTINLNDLGAKRIWLSQSNGYCTTHWDLNTTYLFIYDATNERWELQQGRDTDSDSNGYQVRDYYNRYITGANKIFPYTIIMQNSDGRWESIVTSSSTGTSKARNTHGFRLGQVNLMYANATYEENARIGDGNVFHAYTSGLMDHRYSFNTADNSTSGTIANKPVYLVGTLNASDGLFYLDTTWWTQTLPSTEDGKLYIYIGDAHDYYRMSFVIYNPIYVYTNGKLREFTQDSATVTGHTVAKDVPSNAEFTDTQSDWNATSGKAVILNKPTIPTVNNGTLTIQKNGTQVATFTANQSGNSTANITVPTVTDTYSSTGTDATSGKAVAAALGTLDGTISGTASASKTLTAFSQTDGKVSATFGNISITKSQISDFPSLGTAAAKNYTTSVTSGSSDLVTSGAVYTAIDNLPEPMVFKGTLGTGGTITTLPTAAASNEGYTYKVITAGTYASQAAKVGDVFVSAKPEGTSAYSWILIPAGDIDSDTWRNIKVNGTQLLGNAISTGAVNFKNGSNVTVTGSGNDITIASTDEKVTSSANHYTPDTASGQDKSASASGATAAWSIDVVKGVTLNTDGKGHVTGISVTSGKIPANPNTDTKVRQTLKDSTDNTNRPLLLSYSDSATTTANVDNLAYRNNSIYANPSTGTLTATNLVGNISGATGLTSTQVTTALGYTPPTQDTNTTYTFANGTNGFTVTPSGGTAQTVTVTPSITNNITGSGTSGYIAKFNGANTITNGPAFGSSTTTYLNNAGNWTTPPDTKVTAVGNHYAPAEDSTAQLDADASGGSAWTWNSTNLVSGITVKRDAKGHVTGIGVDSIKVPSNPNTNTVPSAYCDTGATTAAKTATCTDYTLTANTWVHVLIKTANSKAGALTLSINGKTAKPIYINGTASSSSNYTLPAGTYLVYYNGTNYYFRTDGKLTASITGDASTVGGYSIGTTSIGSASAGTAISADDITAWTTNTPTVVTKKTVVTSASFNTVVTGGSTTDVPNISKKTVVTSASGATATFSNGVLTLTDGSFGTGDSVTVGTAIKAYTSLTTGVSGSATTGDSCTVTEGTSASLSYTSRSIPNISVSNKTVATAT